MDTRFIRTIHEEDFIFDYRRVVYWPSEKILMAADLHWGKTHYLRSYGIAVSDYVFEQDLKRLSETLAAYDVTTLIVLGDLIHHEKSLIRVMSTRIEKFRHENPCEVILLKGNHDRFANFPKSWAIREEKDFLLGEFYLSHEFNSKVKKFQFLGHLHPMFKVEGGVDQLRLPAFILTESYCRVPAFSHLTGGRDVKIHRGEEALVVMNEGIISFKK